MNKVNWKELGIINLRSEKVFVDTENMLENKFALKYHESAWRENKILAVQCHIE